MNTRRVPYGPGELQDREAEEVAALRHALTGTISERARRAYLAAITDIERAIADRAVRPQRLH